MRPLAGFVPVRSHRRRRRSSVVSAVSAGTLLGAAAFVGGPAAATAGEDLVLHAHSAAAVPDSYIVVFDDELVAGSAVVSTAHDVVVQYGGTVVQTFESALRGFELSSPASVAAAIAADQSVAYVQQNQVVSADGEQASAATWGLDRIDQRYRPLDGSFSAPNAGGSVHAYVIDTGIRLSHSDFGGRATSGYDAVDGGTASDCNGHGTHVAGTIGGSTYGVAKAVRLVAVRVLNCSRSGTSAQVIAGVNWVTAHAVRPAVANMSLVSGPDTAIENAVRNSIDSGVTYVVEAADYNTNACEFAPARVRTAITVGATTRGDAKADYSNYGRCLDVFAPGSGIVSDWHTSDTATSTLDGTSVAAAHTTGAVALLLDASPTWIPERLSYALTDNATQDIVTKARPKSPNRLLYIGVDSDIAFHADTGKLWSSNAQGNHLWRLGMLEGTSPSITALPDGGYLMAIQANTGKLWIAGPDGNHNLFLGMMAGTSPSIAAVPDDEYQIAFQANTGKLWTASPAGNHNWNLGMMAGSSPSVTTLADGGYQIAMQANTGDLWTAGPAGKKNWRLGLMPGTSPSIAALAGGGYQIAFQADTGYLWTAGPAGNRNWHLGMKAGTSPSIAGLADGGYQIAFQANTGDLWTASPAGNRNWHLQMAAGTSPSITGLLDGTYQIAFHANIGGTDAPRVGDLWTAGPAGTHLVGPLMGDGTSPSIAPHT